MKGSRGRGPAVYREMYRGRRIWTGMIGIDSSARRSFGTPVSVSLRAVRASDAAKPICGVSKVTKYTIVTAYTQPWTTTGHIRGERILLKTSIFCHA